MRLFHRTNTEATTAILRDGFKDRADPTGTNLGFYDQIPEIKAVWFTDVSLDGDDGRLLLLEIPDEVAQKVDKTVRMGLWGRSSLVTRSNPQDGPPRVGEEGKSHQEYIIPAEIANQYGPPTDITDLADIF
ncbi:MAG: hypothetical protein FI737_12715 [SAR202 cluster bacterium]|jgi:hypothetical protein|nr:hypothetical protein [SAR202 cluster bacterium]|tara:strand:+ start:1344 stop:1736 length:393 start_codon:yes stop_codon:yes gene_type:complete